MNGNWMPTPFDRSSEAISTAGLTVDGTTETSIFAFASYPDGTIRPVEVAGDEITCAEVWPDEDDRSEETGQ